MNKITLFVLVLAAALFSSCAKNGGDECRIHGETSNPNLDDKCVYLIAFDKSIRDSVGIDSAFIKDGKFEISTKKNMIGILRMDYRSRYGVEELLVVEEPGDVYVHIDSVSYGRGTKHNDIIQEWKDLTSKMSMMRTPLLKRSYEARHSDNPVLEFKLRATADSLFIDYMQQTRELAGKCDEGPLRQFLLGRIPKTFQKYNADGTTETVNL